jgi:hypothetical protein
MSGKIGDNTGRASGLTKAASSAPTSAAGNPAVDRDESVGTRYINTTSGELFICTDATAGENVWTGQLGTTVQPPKYFGGRGIWSGGYNGATTDKMDYITVASLGNSSDFGNLTRTRELGSEGPSSGVRGTAPGGTTNSTDIDYWTFASLGNAADFGDLTEGRHYGPAGMSNGTRGVMAGGSGETDTIDYITIAATGNATDFGNMTSARGALTGCSSDPGRGIIWGGST